MKLHACPRCHMYFTEAEEIKAKDEKNLGKVFEHEKDPMPHYPVDPKISMQLESIFQQIWEMKVQLQFIHTHLKELAEEKEVEPMETVKCEGCGATIGRSQFHLCPPKEGR